MQAQGYTGLDPKAQARGRASAVQWFYLHIKYSLWDGEAGQNRQIQQGAVANPKSN